MAGSTGTSTAAKLGGSSSAKGGADSGCAWAEGAVAITTIVGEVAASIVVPREADVLAGWHPMLDTINPSAATRGYDGSLALRNPCGGWEANGMRNECTQAEGIRQVGRASTPLRPCG